METRRLKSSDIRHSSAVSQKQPSDQASNMIFSTFNSASPAQPPPPPPPPPPQRATQPGHAHSPAPTFGLSLLEGAGEKLRRLLQASASRQVGRRRAPLAARPVTPSLAANLQELQTTSEEEEEQVELGWQLTRKYTMRQVQEHCTQDDCWLVIFDKVYDISEFVHEHPGGDFILLEYAGADATQPFLSSRHGSSAYKMLDRYWIGILVDEELYYSNNSSYCSVYSNLSWRSAPIKPVQTSGQPLDARAHSPAPTINLAAG